jgi:hypothetical protein
MTGGNTMDIRRCFIDVVQPKMPSTHSDRGNFLARAAKVSLDHGGTPGVIGRCDFDRHFDPTFYYSLAASHRLNVCGSFVP